jgi:hypothetical protein
VEVLKTWALCECFAEARRYQRRPTSYMELAWPLR